MLAGFHKGGQHQHQSTYLGLAPSLWEFAGPSIAIFVVVFPTIVLYLLHDKINVYIAASRSGFTTLLSVLTIMFCVSTIFILAIMQSKFNSVKTTQWE